MTEHIYTFPNITNADELHTALTTALGLADGHTADTVYLTVPVDLTLEQETLTDGSTVMNVILKPRGI